MERLDEIDLITRNTVEIVKEEELRDLISSKDRPKAYTGYEPSGEIHLGHVLTINKLIDLQRAGFEITVLLADVHAYLNGKGTMDEIGEIAAENKRCFLAFGLDESKTNFVLGSDYQLEREYMEDVLLLSREISLRRARRSMDGISREKENPSVSQLIYPLMQVADIAFLKVDAAVGGIDQRKIHMLAREYSRRLGRMPPISIHIPILLGLDGEKMSSSKGNYISVGDSREVMERRIMNAFCPAKSKSSDNPILQLFKYHIFPRFDEVKIEKAEEYGSTIGYPNFSDLEEDFGRGKLHPLDIKNNAVNYLDMMLDSVRGVLS
jgi:tyrosyl-tRNA synthetase